MDTEQLKLLAGHVRSLIKQANRSVGHNQSLDLIAALPGLRNWPEVIAFPDRVSACKVDGPGASRLAYRLKRNFQLELSPQEILTALLPQQARTVENILQIWPGGPASGVYVTTSQAGIDDVRRQSGLAAVHGRKPPKLIHKLMFSMPPGTPPDKVLGAVRNLAREQFALQHRYAFVLHTDEPHPHVHLVLKAVSEQGVRLNIKKATLRHWRSEFARHLRLLGVAANATERAVRGENKSSKKDGIYRASQRGDSTYMRAQADTPRLSASCFKVIRESCQASTVAIWASVNARGRPSTDRRR